MQNYIVRIYRRTEENGGLFGVVEEVGVDGQIAFHSMAELLRLLRGDSRDAGEGSGPGQSGAPGETQGRIP